MMNKKHLVQLDMHANLDGCAFEPCSFSRYGINNGNFVNRLAVGPNEYNEDLSFWRINIGRWVERKILMLGME